MAFEVRQESLMLADGCRAQVLDLRDATGRRLLIAPSLGANILSWHEPFAGDLVELLWHDFATLDFNSSIKHGNPLLFPFANRIRGGQFRWHDRAWTLPRNCPVGEHAIHGFMWRQAMRVDATNVTQREANVTLSEFFEDDSTKWPGGAHLSITTRLACRTMIQEFKVNNVSREAFPFSLGTHPYWRLSPETTQVFVNRDAKQVSVWDLKECLPSGGCLPARGKYARFVEATKAPLGKNRFDDIIRVNSSGSPTWTLQATDGWRLEIEAKGGFRDYVVFTPANRQAVCLEPYTAVTDAVNLYARGIDCGLKVLGPGEEWRGQITVRFIPG